MTERAALEDLQVRVARLEAQMQALLDHFGVGEPSAQADHPSAVLELIRAGKIIEAIKLYRQQSGLGLSEAKAAVEEMQRRFR